MRHFFLLGLMLLGSAVARTPKRLIVLKPAGHGSYAGRVLHDMYERGATYQWAMELKKELERHKIRVLVPFDAHAQDAECISSINQQCPDLVIQLHLYVSTSIQPIISLYHLLLHPLVDTAPWHYSPLRFTPMRRAHQPFVRQSCLYGRQMSEQLAAAQQGQYTVAGLRGIPCKELIGITAPALVIEAGICQDERWKGLVTPVVQVLVTCIKQRNDPNELSGT